MSDIGKAILAIQSRNSLLEVQDFFGREDELAWFKEVDRKGNLQGCHWALYGTRRSGKTILAKQFLKEQTNAFSLVITGDNNATTVENHTRAFGALTQFFAAFTQKHQCDDLFFIPEQLYQTLIWDNFFHYLMEIIRKVHDRLPEIKFYLFFDEIMWFGKTSRFLTSYGYFLNNQNYENSIVSTFLACSSSSWMTENVLHNKNSLYKRLIHKKISPFSFKDICRYFEREGWISNKQEIIKYFLMFGGYIKHYKDCQLNLRKTLEENLSNKAIRKNLFDYIESEANSLFSGIFSEKKAYKEIANLISARKTITFEQLFERLPKDKQKHSVREQLNELEEVDIIRSFTRPSSNQKIYYSNIPLLCFNNLKEIVPNNINEWKGRMFELLVLANIDKIKEHLGLQGKFDYFLDLKLTDDDFQKNGKQNILVQCDLVLEKKGENNKTLKKGEVVLFEIKCRPYENISKEEKNKLEIRTELLELYYQQVLARPKTQVKSFLVLPEYGDISLADLLD